MFGSLQGCKQSSESHQKKVREKLICPMSGKLNPKVCSSIKHKNASGTSNWNNFLKDQGISPVVPRRMSIKRKPMEEISYSKNKMTKVVAIDCEMVGIGENGADDMLARVSIVNSFGDCLYDTFVSPQEEVIDYRTEFSGVRPEDIKDAKDFETVQKEVASILCKRIVVGHSLKCDFAVLYLVHPKWLIRDTSRFFREKGKGTPSLKMLASKYLNTTIQDGEHNSVQDARAAMQLYNMYKQHWESGRGRNKSHNSINNFPGDLEAKSS